MQSLRLEKTVGPNEGLSVSQEKPTPVKGQVKRVWAVFETDEVGNPQNEVAGGGRGLLDTRARTSSLSEVSNTGVPLNSLPSACLPIQSMVREWEVSELIWLKWQHDAISQEDNWKTISQMYKGKLQRKQAKEVCRPQSAMVSDEEKEHKASSTVPFEKTEIAVPGEASYEKSGRVVGKHEETDIVFPSYRLHVENPEGDHFSLSFAAPLVLTKTLLEQKLNCCGKELQVVTFLNLNHEGLSSLGESVLSCWCPNTRFLTADMNRLNALSNAFAGYEKTLEQLSLKDNFLCDLKGLECLHKLQVIHLDGNYILCVMACNITLPSKSSEQKDKGNTESLTGGQRRRAPLLLGRARCLPLFCWPRLRELGLSCNRISKVERLGLLCPNLELLDLGSNNLVSLGWFQESAFFGLRYLRVLDVGQNRLKGRSLWDSLRHCPLLLSLVASRNQLQELPTHDGSVFLRELWLNGNSIKCFSCMAWLPNLQRLYLQDNEIDTVFPIWGFPALEVLDLSFNKISQAEQLQKLGCFSNLRTLQLNDNPVAELPNYTQVVLEAVPWLIELDNEPLTETSRFQAVRNVFCKVMRSVGLEYVRSNILNGKMPCPGVADLSIWAYDDSWVSLNSLIYGKNSMPVFTNNILAGDADIHVLWAFLLDIFHVYSYSTHGKKYKTFTPYAYDCQWRMQSYRLMCLDQKHRLFISMRESASLKGGDESFAYASEMTRYPGEEEVTLAQQHRGDRFSAKRSYITDLDRCLQEHIEFNGCCYKGVLIVNESYALEMNLYCKKVTRLQAVIRGFLVRRHDHRRPKLLSYELNGKTVGIAWENSLYLAENKIPACGKAEEGRPLTSAWRLVGNGELKPRAILRLQALWRGYRTRKRFQLALKESQYEDLDDYDYAMVDGSDFLPQNFEWMKKDAIEEDPLSQGRYNILELPSQLQHYFLCREKLTHHQVVQGNEGEPGKQLQMLIERKAVAVKIARDCLPLFDDKKSQKWLLLALSAKQVPR